MDSTIIHVFCLLFSHMLGENVLPKYSSLDKSDNNHYLFRDSLLYAFLCMCAIFVITKDLFLVFASVVIIFVSYITIDYFYSKFVDRMWKKHRNFEANVFYGFKQLAHQFFLLLTLYLCYNKYFISIGI